MATSKDRYALHFPVRILYLVLSVCFYAGCSPRIQVLSPDPEKPFCLKIATLPGPEDLEILRGKGRDQILLSTHDRRTPDSEGSLQVLDLDPVSLQTGNFRIQALDVDRYPRYFRPHGISQSSFQGKTRIYAISHPHLNTRSALPGTVPRHTIEIFEETGGKPAWKYVGSLQSEKLTSPNDLFALSEERLLVSNDVGDTTSLKAIFDILFRRSTSDITYYEKGNFYFLNARLPFGNGIWYDEKEKLLYRASHVDRSIFVYQTEWPESHPPLLKLLYKITLPGGPDNLYKNEYGFLTAIHTSDWKFLRHSRSPENRAPSQVWEIRKNQETKLLFSDPGDRIPAASTAVRYKNWIFLSQVFEGFLLACPSGNADLQP